MDGIDVEKKKKKVRCPKCTAVLREPQNDIYECPICSTLLLAKGFNSRPPDTNGLKLKENSGSRDGSLGIKSRIYKPRLDEEYGKDQSISILQTKQESINKSKLYEEYGKNQDLGYKNFDKKCEASRSEEESHMLAIQDLDKKITTLCMEISPYSLSERKLSRSGESSFKSEEGDRFSELSSASLSESELEVDPHDEDKAMKDVYVSDLVPNQSTSLNVTSHDESSSIDVLKFGSRTNLTYVNDNGMESRTRDDNKALVGESSTGDGNVYDAISHNKLDHADNKELMVKSFVNSKNDNKQMAEDTTDKGTEKSQGRRLFDLRVFGIFNDRAYEEIKSGKHSHSFTSETTHHVYEDPQRAAVNNNKDPEIEETVNYSTPANFPQQDSNVNGELLVDKEVKGGFLGNARVELIAHAFPSINAVPGLDADALVDARYGNVVSGKDLSPEVLSYVDVSFGDWKSPHEEPDVKSSVDEKRILNSKRNEDADEWDEDDNASTLKMDSKESSLPLLGQSEHSRTSITSRDGVLPERAALPFRTAAMQKFLLQRIEQENIVQDKTDQDVNIYEAPYDFNYVPRQESNSEESIDEKALILPSDSHVYEQPATENRTENENLFNVQGSSIQTQKESLTEACPLDQSEKDARDLHSVAIEDVHAEADFGSKGGKYLDAPIDKMDQMEIEKMNTEQKKVVNASIHLVPSNINGLSRRSHLGWKGKSITESHNDSEGHGSEQVSSPNIGKNEIATHGSEVTEGHSHFDEDSNSGSAQWPRRWNRSFDGDLDSSQQENGLHGDRKFPILDSFNQTNSQSILSQQVQSYNQVEQYYQKPYSLPVGSDRPHPLPLRPFGPMSSIPLHEQGFNHSMYPSYNQPQYHMQPPHMYQNTILHQGIGHRSLHHHDRGLDSEFSSSSSYRESRNSPPRSRRKNRSKMHHKYLGSKEKKQKLYPPLPDRTAAPFVLCKYCNEILEIPSYLPPSMGPVQKLQCGACKKVSKFSVHLQGSNHSGRTNPSSSINNGVADAAYEVEEQFANSGSERSFEKSSLVEQNSQHYLLRNGSLMQPQQKVVQNYVPKKPNNQDISFDVVDHGHYSRAMAVTNRGNMRTCNDGYLSSSPSSASGSSPGKYHSTRVEFGGKNQPQNLVQSKMYEADKSDVEVTFSPDGFYHRNLNTNRNRGSNTRPQNYLSNPANQTDRAELSRNSSRNTNNGQVSLGSPQVIIDPEVETGSLYQDSLATGPRSPPWSPAQGFPLYDHLTQDPDIEWQSQSPRGVSKETKSYAGLLKKSLRDFGKGHKISNRGKTVTVNGHLIPDVAVRKAEQKAGTIHPGTYWYDYRAGFWGVIGSQCQGIVMPYIEEFKFPMEKGCSGGHTGILVNGRELHEKDLDVLAKRGLPTLRGKAYIVDIQGNISDVASGQQLKSLGKLAPSIEKKGRGWGMFQSVRGGQH